tara:strand:+ start:1270 stop:1461 length:192 start_codon:yes stop_codon:yes gene_type:complete
MTYGNFVFTFLLPFMVGMPAIMMGKGNCAVPCAVIWVILNAIFVIMGQVRTSDTITLIEDFIP